MGTFVAKPAEVEKKWVVINAEGLVVGRLALNCGRAVRRSHREIHPRGVFTKLIGTTRRTILGMDRFVTGHFFCVGRVRSMYDGQFTPQGSLGG